MKKMINKKHTRNQKNIASITAIALLVSGTFAWQAFSQMALNESSHVTTVLFNTGGRLHDDYDGINKDVYVENYADVEDGADIFARIRLDEFFEYGEGAGSTNPTDVTLVRGDIQNVETPYLGQLDTWDTYDFGSLPAVGEDENIRTFRDFDFGGSTIYMPTFNKNNNSLDSDINGTYAGPDGDRTTDYDRYADFDVYTDREQSQPTDVLYANPDDEYDELIFPSQIHTAQKTLNAQVLSMEKWIKDGSLIGNYWVYDVDGWAYWASPIAPQTATGLLIDEILITEELEGEWYYGVNVINQSATIEGWNNFREVMDESDITDAGLYLMELVGAMSEVELVFDISDIAIDVPESNSIDTGDSIELSVVVTTDETDTRAQSVTWSINEYEDGAKVDLSDVEQAALDATFVDATFSPIVGMENKTYIITVQPVYETSLTDTILITVHEPEPIPGYTATQIKALAGKTSTLTIDNMAFYVLAVEPKEVFDESGNSQGTLEEAAFLWAKEPWSTSTGFAFHSSSSTWATSSLRSTMSYHIYTKETLLELAEYVDTTVAPFSGDTVETYDRFFLLSQEEFQKYSLGSSSRSSDLAGAISGSLARWLRSPASDSEAMSYYTTSGAMYGATTNSTLGIRPALWVSL